MTSEAELKTRRLFAEAQNVENEYKAACQEGAGPQRLGALQESYLRLLGEAQQASFSFLKPTMSGLSTVEAKRDFRRRRHQEIVFEAEMRPLALANRTPTWRWPDFEAYEPHSSAVALLAEKDPRCLLSAEKASHFLWLRTQEFNEKDHEFEKALGV